VQGKRLHGRVVARSTNGYHITFASPGLPTAEVDHISATTVTHLMRLVKDDHIAFVQRVAEIVASGVVPPGGLAAAQTCRLGRWHDSLTDPTTLALPSFRAIAPPHRAVHECGQSVGLQLLRVTQLGRNGISLTCDSSLNACCAA
jgi:Chemoreceptor zinc-binding domain